MRIFQTFVLPDILVGKLGLSFAAANFSRNLIAGGGFDKAYSLMPVNVTGELGDVEDPSYEVIYSIWRKRGGIRSRLAILAEQWKIFRKVEKGDSIWLYNLNAINAYLFLLLKIFKPSVKRNVIILDFTPAKSWKEQNHWYLKLINMADGTISLSPSDLFKVVNGTVLPGVVPDSYKPAPVMKKINREFLLSGVISETIAMTREVLEAFSENPECTLHITGKVMDNEELIASYAAKYPNIIYHGAISFKDYLSLLHGVTFQLSTRNPEMPENQCNFPSKIIEALLHNRAVVSTIAYPQLENIEYLKFDSKNIADGLRMIAGMDDAQLEKYVNQNEIVRRMFGTKVWNYWMTKIEKSER